MRRKPAGVRRDIRREPAKVHPGILREAGERMKDAVRQVAAATGLSRNALYDAALKA